MLHHLLIQKKTQQINRARFEQLAKEQAASLYGVALRMTRNPDDAKDLVQETLLRAYIKFDTFTVGTNFRAWIFRILTNHYISSVRIMKNAQLASLDEKDDFNSSLSDKLKASPLCEPERLLFNKVMDSEISDALEQLSEGVRLTLLLVDVEQFSYEETAEILDIPIGTVRSRLNRAREQMRAALHSYATSRRLVTTIMRNK